MTEYSNLKMHKTYRYIIYRISDDKKNIVLEKTGDPSLENPLEELHKELLEVEQKRQCRYVVMDFQYGEGKKKIIMINWAPDNATVKEKMIHASSTDAFKKALGTGISRCFQANDISDIDDSTLCKELKAMDRI